MKKSSPAFTLLEVLIAITVLTTSVFILSRLQIKARLRVIQKAEEIERVFFVKKYLYELFLKPPRKDRPRKNHPRKPSPDRHIP